jgi:hypothetical protein
MPDSSKRRVTDHNLPSAEGRAEEMLARYQELVDRKYLQGLTDEETSEMEALGQRIDDLSNDFYAPILSDLRARLKDKLPTP